MLSMYNAGACGALHNHFLLFFRIREGFQSWWLQLIGKNGGELGHDNVLATLND